MKRNRLIRCGCGCGESIFRYDARGRIRFVKWGHNKSNKGRIFDVIARSNMSKAHLGKMTGKSNPSWVGDNITYSGVHKWIRKELGAPSRCWECGTTEAKRFEWANISRRYKRRVDDWKRLCTSCHHKYDDVAAKRWRSRRMHAQQTT